MVLHEGENLKVQLTTFLRHGNRVFPKIDHFCSSARIVLAQNKFSKKVTSYRD